MATKNTFKNVSRVTKDFNGQWMGAGWYAYEVTKCSNGRFGKVTAIDHIGIEYLRHELDMNEEYVDYIGDYRFAVAEYVGGEVAYVHFADDYVEIEDSYIASCLANADWDEDEDEDERLEVSRAWFEENCTEVNEYGDTYYSHMVETDRAEVTFGAWSADC